MYVHVRVTWFSYVHMHICILSNRTSYLHSRLTHARIYKCHARHNANAHARPVYMYAHARRVYMYAHTRRVYMYVHARPVCMYAHARPIHTVCFGRMMTAHSTKTWSAPKYSIHVASHAPEVWRGQEKGVCSDGLSQNVYKRCIGRACEMLCFKNTLVSRKAVCVCVCAGRERNRADLISRSRTFGFHMKFSKTPCLNRETARLPFLPGQLRRKQLCSSKPNRHGWFSFIFSQESGQLQ